MTILIGKRLEERENIRPNLVHSLRNAQLLVFDVY